MNGGRSEPRPSEQRCACRCPRCLSRNPPRSCKGRSHRLEEPPAAFPLHYTMPLRLQTCSHRRAAASPADVVLRGWREPCNGQAIRRPAAPAVQVEISASSRLRPAKRLSCNQAIDSTQTTQSQPKPARPAVQQVSEAAGKARSSRRIPGFARLSWRRQRCRRCWLSIAGLGSIS